MSLNSSQPQPPVQCLRRGNGYKEKQVLSRVLACSELAAGPGAASEGSCFLQNSPAARCGLHSSARSSTSCFLLHFGGPFGGNQGQCPQPHGQGRRPAGPLVHTEAEVPGWESGRCLKTASRSCPSCSPCRPTFQTPIRCSLEHTVVIVASVGQGRVKAPRAVGHFCRRVFQVGRALQKTHLHSQSPRALQFCSVPVSPSLKSPEVLPHPRMLTTLRGGTKDLTVTLLHHCLCLLRSSCVAPSREPGDTCPVDGLALPFQVSPPPTVSPIRGLRRQGPHSPQDMCLSMAHFSLDATSGLLHSNTQKPFSSCS